MYLSSSLFSVISTWFFKLPQLMFVVAKIGYPKFVCKVIDLCTTQKSNNKNRLEYPFNPNQAGGGGGIRPPRRFAQYLRNATSSRRDVSWLFSFKYRATFETKFVAPARTVLSPRPFKKNSSSPKLLKNVISCTNPM